MTPPTNTLGMEFEVFLSFRGPDTRDNFTSCLYHDMIEKGIRVFKDDQELRIGQQIGGNLLRALNDTQIYIPILSKGFASSVWCLREVAHMIDCTSKSDGEKEILPVFFDVEPDDVKLKTELYRSALSKHEEKYGSDVVKHWEAALVEVPTRVGWKLEGKGYGELIKLIVRELLLKLKRKNRPLPNHLLETDDLERVKKLLDIKSNGHVGFLDIESKGHVRFLIIHGIGGIGKSTLAGVLFNQFQTKFSCSSFLDDVPSQGLLDMQKKLLSDTLGSTSTDGIHDTNDGIDRIRRGLSNKKVLVVVDNVDKKSQLEKLVGGCDWFGSGSRIIITTRDKSIILDKDNQTPPENYFAYPMMEMPIHQAIQLFSKHAFRSDTPPKGCYNFSKGVVSSIGRLPLTLEVVGSLFANTVRSKWDKTLENLKQVPHRHVRETLMISINKLDSIEKIIFLDIACFCIGEDKTYAEYMWHSSGYPPDSAIDALLLMSLIKINGDNTFWMHDEVRDLGRYMVKEGNIEDAGKRRWVKIEDDTLDILTSNEEKRAIRALSLRISYDLTPGELARLPMLRFLGGERLNLVGDFKNFLGSLRWLSWRHCPQDFSAMNLHLVNLVVLNLSESKITDDWGGWGQIEVPLMFALNSINRPSLASGMQLYSHTFCWHGNGLLFLKLQMAKNLKVLDLTCCKELTKTPDFSKFGKLEKLILDGCWNLSTIDSSISKLKLLSILNINRCISLQGLPEEIGFLESLSKISMPYFQNPVKLPETFSNLKSLTRLKIPGDITQLPFSIGRLNLTHLVLSLCTELLELPDSIGELESLIELELYSVGISILPYSIGRLKNLKHLVLYECNNLHELPDSIGGLKSLVELVLAFSSIFVLPDSIGRLTSLTYLSFHGCENLLELPNSIGELEALIELDLALSGMSVLPDSIGKLKNLKFLFLSECTNLHELPDSIVELESLTNLDLKFSGISTLSNLIGRVQNSRDLYFGGNNNLLELYHPIRESELLFKLELNLSGVSVLLDFIGRFTCLEYMSFCGCKNLHELPDSIKQMELLVKLDLQHSGISFLPDSIGNLKRLKFLNLAYTKIRTIPSTLGGVETLEELNASFCRHLMDEISWEMWSLTCLRRLDLNRSPISTVPRKIGSFSTLQTLKIASHRLSLLPELPLSLECLMVAATEFPVLPDLSSLVHLHDLEVRKQRMTLGIPTEVTSPWKDRQSINRLPLSLSTLKLHSIPQLPDIFYFGSLSSLSISECPVPCLSDLSRLKRLQTLWLSDFPKLAELPGLGELESLTFLHITMCDVIERLPNLSKLKNLLRLELKHCANLRAIEGLEELEILEYVQIRYCISLEKLPDVPTSTKLETEPTEDTVQPAKRFRLV